MRGEEGCPPYRAPEMLSQDVYDNGVDMWALGIVIYESFFKKHPFMAKYTSTTADNISNKELDLTPMLKNFSQLAKNFLARCLQKDPEKRITVE